MVTSHKKNFTGIVGIALAKEHTSLMKIMLLFEALQPVKRFQNQCHKRKHISGIVLHTYEHYGIQYIINVHVYFCKFDEDITKL